MASKQLSIMVKVVDQATGPLAGVTQKVLGVGSAVVNVETRATASMRGGTGLLGWVGKLTSGLLSLKGLVGGALGGFAAYLGARGVWSALDGAAQTLESIGDLADRLGLSVKAVSQLRYAAKLANIDLESLAGNFSTANKNITQFALTGTGRASDALKRIGLNVRDSRGQIRSFNDVLPELLDGLAKLPKAERAFAANKIFGGGGDRFLLFINKGASALKAYNKEADALGVVFDEEQIRAASRYRDAVDRISEAWLGLRVNVLTRIAPDLTDILNKGAQVLAAIPAMVKTGMATIRTALGEGPEANAAAAKIRKLLESLVNLAAVSVRAGLRVALAVLVNGIPALMDAVGPAIRRQTLQFMANLGIDSIAAMAKGIAYAGNAVLGPAFVGSVFPAIEMGVDHVRDQTKSLVDYMVGVDATLNGVVNRFDNTYDKLSGDSREFSSAMNRNALDFIAAGRSAITAADGVIGWIDALAKTAFNANAAADAMEKFNGQVDAAPSKWERFVNGAKTGLGTLADEVENIEKLGESVAVTGVGGFADAFAKATVESEGSLKKFMSGFRQFVADMLKQIAQLILRWLALRAIMSLAGAIAGGASEVPETAAAAPGTYAGNIGTPLETGGVLARIGNGVVVQRFDRGGVARGPMDNRDSIPAVLRHGEGVVNNAGMNVNGAAMVHYMNRGGRVVPEGSGGGSINITNVIQISGQQASGGMSPKDLKAIEDAAANGTLRALQRSPSYRGEMRRAIA